MKRVAASAVRSAWLLSEIPDKHEREKPTYQIALIPMSTNASSEEFLLQLLYFRFV